MSVEKPQLIERYQQILDTVTSGINKGAIKRPFPDTLIGTLTLLKYELEKEKVNIETIKFFVDEMIKELEQHLELLVNTAPVRHVLQTIRDLQDQVKADECDPNIMLEERYMRMNLVDLNRERVFLANIISERVSDWLEGIVIPGLQDLYDRCPSKENQEFIQEFIDLASKHMQLMRVIKNTEFMITPILCYTQVEEAKQTIIKTKSTSRIKNLTTLIDKIFRNQKIVNSEEFRKAQIIAPVIIVLEKKSL